MSKARKLSSILEKTTRGNYRRGRRSIREGYFNNFNKMDEEVINNTRKYNELVKNIELCRRNIEEIYSKVKSLSYNEESEEDELMLFKLNNYCDSIFISVGDMLRVMKNLYL